MKKLLITTAAGLMFALPVVAQSTQPTTPETSHTTQPTGGTATPPMASATTVDPAWANVTADELKGKAVTGLDDKKVGDVADVVMGSDASVSKIVVDVGGFPGMGAKPVALDPSQLTLVRGEDADDITLRVAATEDELKAMPEYQG